MGATPLPFDGGATLEDIYTGAAVTVSAINPPHPRTGNPRAGFEWKNAAGESGFVPYNSVGCYKITAAQ